MARYFYIRDDVYIREMVVDTTRRNQALSDIVTEIVGWERNPSNGVPYAIEADGWGELASIGELYETPEFLVECITEEEYKNF